MKKYIFSVLMAAMAAFTFSSCEDVPEPYTQPSKPETGGDTEGTPSGTGTAADPYNSVAVIQYCQSLEAGVESAQEVYIKGKVQSIKEEFGSFGNASFYIADDANSATFYVYRTLYLGNKKWTSSDDQIKVGDEVVVCGNVVNYQGNTPETVQNKTYLVSVNGKTAGGDTPAAGEAKGDGTEANPFNSVAANNEASKLATGETTEKSFYIKGKIQNIKYPFDADHGTATVNIADDANSATFLVYSVRYFGGEKWKEGDTQLKEGDEIVVSANLTNYNGTLETKNAKLISINGKTSGGSSETPSTPDTPAGITIDGTTVTLASGATAGESVKVDLSTLGYTDKQVIEKVELSDGTTITFDANGETNKATYYNVTKGIRVYKNHKIIFNGKSNIAKIVLTCDSYNGTDYVGNETATIEFSGKTATYTNVFTGTTGGGVQLRIKTIEIVYAK